MGEWWGLLRGWRTPTLDPMRTLELQTRLGRLAAELRRCDTHRGFAAAHHSRAALSAYETTLRQSLRHVGTNDEIHGPGDVVSLELDLASRGWQW
ncbi:hypothetical protein EDD28_0619 [Salana multivorans]|uniref:Uncharacterized protein n=1 Tax=Salana multivorans TaxID=120377 RepID=A0A3N2D8C9_9MICO|nr:hypothetical protein [Salana multivorans]MBN8880911.1 hypothetical protein [Salana multivorans]OJX93829.1 MAG: hypothetical protein BGO96_10090 [Micrococcales bacterium 73-15]ROR96045.1 hypothetical protein EDD28_0619 [Salana multivorans]